jgi:hypothetical protein
MISSVLPSFPNPIITIVVHTSYYRVLGFLFLGIFVCSQSGYHPWEDEEDNKVIIPRKI